MRVQKNTSQIAQVECDEPTSFSQSNDDFDSENSIGQEKNTQFDKNSNFNFNFNFNKEKATKQFNNPFTNAFKNQINEDSLVNYERRIKPGKEIRIKNADTTKGKNILFDSPLNNKLLFVFTPKSETKNRIFQNSSNIYSYEYRIENEFQKDENEQKLLSNKNYDLKELIRNKSRTRQQ